MPVRAWAEAATFAKSAVACNAGTLNRARESGVQRMEVFDGAEWRSRVEVLRLLTGCGSRTSWAAIGLHSRRSADPYSSAS